MKINAKYFGSLSYDPEDLIYLPDGLFGFESYKNFLPLPFHETTDSLLSFQSTDDETLSFILMNPLFILSNSKRKSRYHFGTRSFSFLNVPIITIPVFSQSFTFI